MCGIHNKHDKQKNRSNTLISRPLARAPTTAPHKQDSMRCNDAWSEWHRQRWMRNKCKHTKSFCAFFFIFHIYNYIVVDVLGALVVSLAVCVCASCVFVYCIRTFTFRMLHFVDIFPYSIRFDCCEVKGFEVEREKKQWKKNTRKEQRNGARLFSVFLKWISILNLDDID